MKESASFFSYAFKVISCSFLNSLWAPVCTNISEDLSSVCKKFHEHHSKSVENVILCSEDIWLTSSVPVEGCVQHSFCKVTVWIEICPLSLSLETSCQSVVSDCFLGECRIKVIAAVHQLFDDNCHFNYELKLLFFLLWGELQFFRVLVPTNLTGLFRPFESFLKFCVIVDAFCHTTDDFYLINGFNTHSKIGFDEIGINDRSADTHCNGTDLQIGFASHGSSCNCCTSESE